ncbi:MAG: acyl--CoA ligase [Planctomycetes bacterium]|nr:acyl--CoA ligase [Planctomycetota bacterium]
MEIFKTIYDHAQVKPDSVAFVDDAGELTWEQLNTVIDRLALGLVHAGMRRGQSAVLLAGRSIANAVSMLAVMRGGGTVAPIPPSIGAESISRIIEATQPSLLVYEHSQVELVRELCLDYEFRSIICLGEPSEGELSWEELSRTSITGARFPVLHEDAVSYYNADFSPSGNLRLALGSMDNLWRAAGGSVRGLKLKDESCHLSLYASGFNVHESVVRAIRLGGKAVFSRKIHPRDVIKSILENKVDCLSAPSCYYNVFCDWLKDNMVDLECLQCLEGRGHASSGLLHRVKELIGHELIPTCSFAETFGPAFGRVPSGFGAPSSPFQCFPGLQDKIALADGKEIMDDRVGELWLSGSSIARETIEPGLESVKNIDAEEWFHTGIMARRHDSGEIQLLGSRYNVVLRNGHKVYPGVLAEVLEGYPGVREAVGVLVQHRIGEFSLVGAILPEPGEELDATAIMCQVMMTLDPPSHPDDVMFFENFPRLPDGSIDMHRLRYLTNKRFCK